MASAQTLTLQLSCSSLSFTDTTPLSQSDVPAAQNPVSATVTFTGEGVVHIFMLANTDLIPANGGPSIPATNVYWKANGSGYMSGTLSSTEQVEAASGPLSTNAGAGWQFFLSHSLYESGTYQISITVMATAQ